MAEIGYTLSSEETGPRDLVRYASRAEEVGFSFAMISDHFHPWVDRQGHSPFVWSTLGGVAAATERLKIGTGVTCPTVRIHPAIIAQAAATTAAMMPGRFSLGVGTGEKLNEHILGDAWPPVGTRQDMLEEAIEVIRGLWEGGLFTHQGRHYTVENARLYTLPEEPPPILIAAAGDSATAMAGRIGDGFIGLVPDPEVIERFERAGGQHKPRYGQLHVCWAETEEKARSIAYEWWPNGAIPGNLFIELPLPSHFEEAASLVSEDDVAEGVVCGPDPERHLGAIREFIDAGYTHVYVHQVGPDEEGMLRFYEQRVLPELTSADATVRG
jgi:G6PDH family F420-dependent oxidoreductase